MVYRKGELTSAGIDRGWPHQVALTAEYIQGRQYMILHRFCNGLSVCPRHQHYRKDDREYVLYCFKEKSDAQLFPDALRRRADDARDQAAEISEVASIGGSEPHKKSTSPEQSALAKSPHHLKAQRPL